MKKPSRIIGENYLHRWHVIPRNRFLNIYLHKYLGSDDDRALHDHPWHSVSFLLRGVLAEVYRAAPDVQSVRYIPWLRPVFRSARFSHRLVLTRGPAWTLFITGPRIRPWGFWCESGWRHWQLFTDDSGNRVGRGCE